eukprot:3278787-Rhodomonas_salina.1
MVVVLSLSSLALFSLSSRSLALSLSFARSLARPPLLRANLPSAAFEPRKSEAHLILFSETSRASMRPGSLFAELSSLRGCVTHTIVCPVWVGLHTPLRSAHISFGPAYTLSEFCLRSTYASGWVGFHSARRLELGQAVQAHGVQQQ